MSERDSAAQMAATKRLLNIKERRSQAPDKDEIQEAVTEGLNAGLTVTDIANLTGIPRQQFYQGKYDLTANHLARKQEPPERYHRP